MTTILFTRLALRAALLPAALAALAACSNAPKSDVGLVDVGRITANWPKFQNYQNQLQADVLALQQSHASNADKVRQQAQLQQRYARAQGELTGEVQEAAKTVAAQKNLKLVFTRQYVGYGGVDITPDIEKVLKIDEKAPSKS